MLGHPHRHRGQVEHLPPLHIHLRRAYQVRAAASARTGLMPQPLVRIGDLPQRRTRMPGLPARLASTPTPQRPRCRLGKRRVRRRRLRRVLRVLPQPGGQLSNLSPQRLDHHPKLRVLGGKLLIGRTRISGHHTMVDNPARRSTSHAEDLPVTSGLGFGPWMTRQAASGAPGPSSRRISKGSCERTGACGLPGQRRTWAVRAI